MTTAQAAPAAPANGAADVLADGASDASDASDASAAPANGAADVLADGASDASADVVVDGASAIGDVEALEAVEVEADREPGELGPRSINRIDREDLKRQQPRDLYEALQGTPGVAIEGGPRTQGKRVVIRGFSDNEDVLVRIDGATQNFEKYRFGSGIDIDPNLVRSIDVRRGASTLTEGSGAVGGVLLVETLDAADLLRPDARLGAEWRLTYGNNDRSQWQVANVFGRPTEWLDVLVSKVRRDGENIRLPSGEELADSSEQTESSLYKVELAGKGGFASLLHRDGRFAGLQPLDATGGGAGIFGNVRRLTTESSNTLQWAWRENDWLDLTGALGHTLKHLQDRNSFLAAGGEDIFDFDVLTVDLRNQIRTRVGPFGLELAVGLQGTNEARDTFRIPPGQRGFVNLAQPPGIKLAYGGFFEPVLHWGDFRATGAVRLDRYQVTPVGPTADLVRAQGGQESIAFVRVSPGYGVTYTPRKGPFTFFYDYFEAFRPPLMDEYFTSGAFSRCQAFTRFTPRPQGPGPAPTPPRRPVRPVRGEFPPGAAGTAAFSAALADFNVANTAYLLELDRYLMTLDLYLVALDAFLAAEAAWPLDPRSQVNAICGEAYVPEEASTHEFGVLLQKAGLLSTRDRLSARIAFFRTDVRHTLESIFENALTGEVSQPGIERREGVELEFGYQAGGWEGRFSLATVDGFYDLGEIYFRQNVNRDLDRLTTAADRGRQPLFDLPGTIKQFQLLHRWAFGFEVAYRARFQGERLFAVGERPGCPFVLPFCLLLDEQPGFLLHQVTAAWNPAEQVSLQIAVDNLTDTEYLLPGFGGGPGAIAPGRNAMFTVGIRF